MLSMGGNRGWWRSAGAKHGGEEDMWVDAVALGGSREMTDMQASEGEIIVGTF
jgi:hypothetical protein